MRPKIFSSEERLRGYFDWTTNDDKSWHSRPISALIPICTGLGWHAADERCQAAGSYWSPGHICSPLACRHRSQLAAGDQAALSWQTFDSNDSIWISITALIAKQRLSRPPQLVAKCWANRCSATASTCCRRWNMVLYQKRLPSDVTAFDIMRRVSSAAVGDSMLFRVVQKRKT
jgi:hypothetical protein